MISRRTFVKTTGLLSLSGLLAPNFLAATAGAQGASLANGQKALVVVQLSGGNDGLNTVVPFSDGAYYKARPELAIKASEVLRLNNDLGLHPSLKPLKDLYDKGQVAIVRGVGYPNPSYSHFRAMAIWQSAQPSVSSSSGWLGRYLENQTVSPAELSRLGMTVGSVGQGGGAPLAFWTDKTVVLSYNSPGSFQFRTDNDRAAQLEAARAIFNTVNSNPTAEYIRKTASDAINASDSLTKIATDYKPMATYPKTGFADRLKIVAQVLASDFGSRIFYLQTDGSFDTHTNQLATHTKLFQTLSEGLAAFYQDLAAHGLADSVLTMTVSEFGRRVTENGSHGTDHGSASPLFIVGGKNVVKPGLYGEQPSLTNLDNGNLKASTDFRSVYATVLKNWLGVNPALIVGGDFPPLNFVG